jgi:iron complex transport system substrate-binding protein
VPFQTDAAMRATVEINIGLTIAAHGKQFIAVDVETAAAGLSEIGAGAQKLHGYPQMSARFRKCPSLTFKCKQLSNGRLRPLRATAVKDTWPAVALPGKSVQGKLRMRLSTRVVVLCVGLLASLQAVAADLPQRWVSAGGALSEWVSALGGESKLVGVDTTSQHPQSLKMLPSIGYQRSLSAEGILNLRPDILIGTEEMGPPPVIAQVKSAKVQVELFSAQPDLSTLEKNITHLGQLLGAQAQAAQLLESYQQQLTAQKARVAELQARHKTPGVLVLIGHAGGKPLIAGKDTAADWLLQQAGGHNLATHTGYKPFSVESLAGLDPEVLVLADRALSGEAAKAALFKENPILNSSRAAKAGRVLELDPTLLVGGLGPRLPAALKDLSDGFYPTASGQ